MNLFIIGDIFTGLKPWLLEDKDPVGMPAVYNFYNYLGKSKKYKFKSIIINKEKNRTIEFENGSEIKLIKLNIKNQYLFRIIALFYAFFISIKYIKNDTYDLIYGMANYSMVSTLLGKFFSIYSVSRMFGAFSPKYIQEKKYFPIYTRFIFEYLATKYAGNLFISTEDGTQHHVLVNYTKNKSEFYMLFNGIDEVFKNELLRIEKIDKISSKKTINISYIGRLSWWKRQDLALNTVEELVKKYNLDIQLYFLGDGPDLEKLKNIAKEKGIEKNITFLGAVARKKYLRILKDIDISLYLYDFSNLGNSLWETMYAGKLIATKSSGDTSKYLTNNKNSIIVNENDDGKDIAKNIYQYLDKDISNITSNSRCFIKDNVTIWETRIEKEINLIKNNLRRYQ